MFACLFVFSKLKNRTLLSNYNRLTNVYVFKFIVCVCFQIYLPMCSPVNSPCLSQMLIGWQVGWKREGNGSGVHKKWEKCEKNAKDKTNKQKKYRQRLQWKPFIIFKHFFVTFLISVPFSILYVINLLLCTADESKKPTSWWHIFDTAPSWSQTLSAGSKLPIDPHCPTTAELWFNQYPELN